MILSTNIKSPLAAEIVQAYQKLIAQINKLPYKQRLEKNMPATSSKISIVDCIAYQIGWGKLLIYWYETGLQNKVPEMPMPGFSWDYNALGHFFYANYSYDSGQQQLLEFQRVVERILTIVDYEFTTENLDKLGVWQWCTLKSGKQWPLSKWIRINTIAPYKRAAALIKKSFKK